MHKPVSSPVLNALRSATADHHKAVEATLRLQEEWDLAHYRQVLRGFHGYLTAWEPALAAALPLPLRPWFQARSRLPWLRADLEVLGLSECQPASSDAGCLRLPVLRTLESAMGSLYVMEGSALGGQWIARQLRLRHGRGACEGGAYFHGWGDRTGAMWRGFLVMLEEQVGDADAAIAQACHAAVATFSSLTEHFEALLDERVAP